jgi:uncharacterized protein YjiS (DUF1127 family)
MTSSCYPPVVLPTQRPLLQRWLADLTEGWEAWRARAAESRALRAMEGLSDETLRDIGMAERLPPQPVSLGLLDYERGRWG